MDTPGDIDRLCEVDGNNPRASCPQQLFYFSPCRLVC